MGSLSAGGAGKTPVVILLVQMLHAAGHGVDILSRGYRRTGRGIELVDPTGPAARFGDEPLLLARRLAVPVWVGADRHATGQRAEAAHPGFLHVLDDGFQHRRLGRTADIVLLTLADVADTLLPAGNLREPLHALRRAHVIVLREEEAAALRPHFPPGRPVWIIRRRLAFLAPAPAHPLVFCAIARPESFTAMLSAQGIQAVARETFPDHHPFGMRDITRLLTAARSHRADSFLTTAKDAVKLTPPMRRRLEELGPLVIADLELDLLAGSLADLPLP